MLLRAGVVPALGLLGACAPEFDWREVSCADGAVRCLLPGKPAEMSRRIHLRDSEVEMKMTGAQAGGLSFTVAMVVGTPHSHADARAQLDAMREQMLRNVSAPPGQGVPIGVSVIDASGRRSEPRAGIEVSSPSGNAVHMIARFFIARGRPTQAVVLGNRQDEERARQFLDSITIVGG